MMNQGNSTGSLAPEKVTAPKMDAALKAKWVEALRSGKFKQATGKLKRDDGYCCLGVLCEVAGYRIDAERDYIFSPGSSEVRTSYGPLDNLGINAEARHPLISKNDNGSPFPEIADYIEANL